MSKKKKQLTIAIDYDTTYTEDPKLFETIIEVMKKAGHRVLIITNRGAGADEKVWPRKEVVKKLGNVVEIIFAGQYRSKWQAARDNGVVVDIWIDDNPHHVVMAPFSIPGWSEKFDQDKLGKLKEHERESLSS